MKSFFKITAALLIAAVAGLAIAAGTGTGTATWMWSAPTAFTDGTPIPSTDTITYNLYLGSAPGAEAATPAQTGITALTATSTGFSAGQEVCGNLTAVVNGLESAHSNEACKTFPAVPNPPTGLTVK